MLISLNEFRESVQILVWVPNRIGVRKARSMKAKATCPYQRAWSSGTHVKPSIDLHERSTRQCGKELPDICTMNNPLLEQSNCRRTVQPITLPITTETLPEAAYCPTCRQIQMRSQIFNPFNPTSAKSVVSTFNWAYGKNGVHESVAV